jgi:hypothetical protein
MDDPGFPDHCRQGAPQPSVDGATATVRREIAIFAGRLHIRVASVTAFVMFDSRILFAMLGQFFTSKLCILVWLTLLLSRYFTAEPASKR